MFGEHQGQHGGEGAGDDEAVDEAQVRVGGIEGRRGGGGAGQEQQEVLHQRVGDEAEEAAGVFEEPGACGGEEDQN